MNTEHTQAKPLLILGTIIIEYSQNSRNTSDKYLSEIGDSKYKLGQLAMYTSTSTSSNSENFYK